MEHPETAPPYTLPPDLHRRALTILRRTLPPPCDGDAAAQLADAIGTVTSLCPANPEETLLAIQFVVADARSMEVLEALNSDPQDERRRLAQSASMMRQSRGARSLLLRVHTARQRHARASDATARRGVSHARVPPTDPRSVTISETKSHLTGNETTMRQNDRLSAAEAALARLSKMLPVSHNETKSRRSGIETPMRQRSSRPAATAGRSLSPADSASDRETNSRLSGNETPMRRASSPPHVPATAIARNSLPFAEPVSISEMLSRLAGNETPVRRDSVVSMAGRAPGRWPNPRPASEWAEEPLFTRPLSLTARLLAGTAQVPETIVPRYRYPDANGLGRTATR